MRSLRKIGDKKGIAMSFNWIFAILAGGFILFLAIFSAGKFIRTGEQILYTETAASLISLLDPLETGLASGKAHEIGFKKKSKIFFDCEENLNPPFGKQTISFSEKTFGAAIPGPDEHNRSYLEFPETFLWAYLGCR